MSHLNVCVALFCNEFMILFSCLYTNKLINIFVSAATACIRLIVGTAGAEAEFVKNMPSDSHWFQRLIHWCEQHALHFAYVVKGSSIDWHFSCHNEDDLSQLKKAYESGLLAEKIKTIFNVFSCSSGEVHLSWSENDYDRCLKYVKKKQNRIVIIQDRQVISSLQAIY